MRLTALLPVLLLLSWPAQSADNYPVKDGSGNTIRIKSRDVGGGLHLPQFIPSDPTGAPIGVSGTPLFVSLSSGTSVNIGNFPSVQPVSISVLPLPTGAATSAAQATANSTLSSILSSLSLVTTRQARTSGANFSSAVTAPTGALLLTIPAAPTRNFVEVQNQSASTVQVVRDDGAGNEQTVLLLSGIGQGQQGAGWSSSTFSGRIRVYGPAGSTVAAYQD